MFEPEIPPNSGNIIRLCANTGCRLHFIEPLGFSLDDRSLKRAGLDYHEFTSLTTHASFDAFLDDIGNARLFAFSTHGTGTPYATTFAPGDVFLFGPETRGLPDDIRAQLPGERLLRIPMRPGSRSLNLSNAVAVVVYEAWRQQQFA